MRKILSAFVLLLCCLSLRAQQHTFFSQFRKTDSLQVAELWSPQDNEYRQIGHHGPAVENQYMALRFYYDGRGAIDVYNKSGLVDDELGKWHWYPSAEAQAEQGAGCDEYYVGKTFGLGGVRLWDGEKEIRLDATAGRRSVVGRRGNSVFMEMTAYGVEYKGDKVDIAVRVDMFDGSRWANVSARELNGKKVQFATGVNYHSGSIASWGRDYIAVWGSHPADVSKSPQAIGGALRFSSRKFSEVEDTGKTFRIISNPASSISTSIASASVKESELCDAVKFLEFAADEKLSLSVVTYNIRLGIAKDGDNSWDKRKPATVQMLNKEKPDVFGLQEAYGFQVDYILENCPQYQAVGVGREDGKEEGEKMSVFWNRKRFKLQKWGTYWLSETPEQPSKGWDAACKRTATWVLLKDRSTGRKFYYVNTHLDHKGREARRQGLSLIVDRIDAMNPEGYPMLLGGDFNVIPKDPCLHALDGRMKDSRLSAQTTDNNVTFNGWGRYSGESVDGRGQIDYIYWKDFSACASYRVLSDDFGAPYISDHYPVRVDFIY